MIVYGANPVLEAIRSHPERVRFIAVAKEHSGRMQKIIADAQEAGVAVRFLPMQQVNKLAGRGVHNGIVAEVSETAYVDFDAMLALEETTFVLILDHNPPVSANHLSLVKILNSRAVQVLFTHAGEPSEPPR